MPEQPSRRNNRQQLLDGALACVREKGYARTTARDVATASGANLGSIGYHFGGMDGLLEEALGQCFELWTARVRLAVTNAGTDGPRAMFEAALSALVDNFEELRPLAISCVEAFPPALRSDALRARLAASYSGARQAGSEMITQAYADLGVNPPEGVDAMVSVFIALCEGLMLQWLVDPGATPNAARTIDALAMLAPFVSESY